MRLMRTSLTRNAPSLQPMAHGYMVLREQGPRLIGHGGNTADFHSYMVLAPEANFAFFVSTTGGQGSYGGRTELMNAIIGRVFPAAPAPRWTGKAAPAAGSYRTNRRTYSETPNPATTSRSRHRGSMAWSPKPAAARPIGSRSAPNSTNR
ncbi:hypothetical protein DdX_20390 [Ditylenchus destructor]|uniref:Beta-lactamase-related domain-containing protein n=1 Tax=Ditylenchus destructor TaxID=166010 RepID=A0AAD4MIS6_9BILA|nr:hypothetical protein DdX_20390 [Ditylenchus destructor]